MVDYHVVIMYSQASCARYQSQPPMVIILAKRDQHAPSLMGENKHLLALYCLTYMTEHHDAAELDYSRCLKYGTAPLVGSYAVLRWKGDQAHSPVW